MTKEHQKLPEEKEGGGGRKAEFENISTLLVKKVEE